MDRHSDLSPQDEEMMRRALELARRNLGRTSPNPSVGCVIVANGTVVGEAATAPGGRPHAEALALASAGNKAYGATAYVTFEPCAHHGKTPPCARALADAGIKRVVVGCLDPYPPVRGRGVKLLKNCGIKVTLGVLEKECKALNEGFITRVLKGRPFVLLKLAMTLDGRIASPSGDSQWVTASQARMLVHQWRNEYDAIMVGTNTVLKDNPRLTCRIAGGRDPIRIVLDAKLRTPTDARVFNQSSKAPTILVTSKANYRKALECYANNLTQVIYAPCRGGKIALEALLRILAKRGICKVLIEGGAHLAGSALMEKVVDRVAIFVAPKILGSGLSAIEGVKLKTMREAIKLKNVQVRAVGPDWLFEGEPS